MLMYDEEQQNNFAQQPSPPELQSNEIDPKYEQPLVSWSASEFIAHHKSSSWYIALAAAVGFLSAIVYLLTRDVLSTVVIIITGTLFGVFASRKPEVRNYQIYTSGIQISEKFFPFDALKSFAIHEEGAFTSIYLLSTQRFMPPLTIYYPPDQEEGIVSALTDYLPKEDREPDAIDNLMRKIRF